MTRTAWKDGVDDAGGSDVDDDGAVGPHDDADYVAGSDAFAEAADGLVGSVAANDGACRVTNQGCAEISRTCLVCGETSRSGSTFFDRHLDASYEYPNTPAHALGAGTAGATSPSAASEAALPFAVPSTTEPVFSAIGASMASGASGARDSVNLGGGARSLIDFGSSAESAKPPRGPPCALLAPNFAPPTAPDLPVLLAAVLARLLAPRCPVTSPFAPARSGRPCARRRRGWCGDPERRF